MKFINLLVVLSVIALTACDSTDQQPQTGEGSALSEKTKEWTEMTKELGAAAVESTKEAAGAVAETVKEKAGELYEGAKDKSADLYEDAKEQGGELVDKTKEMGADATESAKADMEARDGHPPAVQD